MWMKCMKNSIVPCKTRNAQYESKSVGPSPPATRMIPVWPCWKRSSQELNAHVENEFVERLSALQAQRMATGTRVLNSLSIRFSTSFVHLPTVSRSIISTPLPPKRVQKHLQRLWGPGHRCITRSLPIGLG